MSNGWKCPILVIHGRQPMEVIDSPSETYNRLGGHPTSFLGLGFFDASGGLWEITHIKVLGGRPPDNGWRFPWSNPARFFGNTGTGAIFPSALAGRTLRL